MNKTFTSAALVLGLFLCPAHAGEDKIPLDEVPVIVDDFEADFRIDGWIVQIDVGLESLATGLSSSVFIGFDDIISNLDWIVPLGADLRYKRVGFLPDLVALKMSGGGTSPGPFFDKASYDLKLGILGLPAYLRLIDQPKTKFDLIGGARYLWIDFDIGLEGGSVGDAFGAASAGTEAKIWDGIVGMRVQHEFTDKLFCSVYGDVGTGDSDLTYQILADVGYRFNDRFSLSAGYRYLHYDLGDADSNVELTGSGPQVTLNWKF